MLFFFNGATDQLQVILTLVRNVLSESRNWSVWRTCQSRDEFRARWAVEARWLARPCPSKAARTFSRDWI